MADSPATTDSRLAQRETPSTSITNVQVNSTPNGLEVLLNTTGTTPVVTTSSYDQTLLIDILDAQLVSQFQQEDPIPGITSITVTPLYNNSVRLTIKGETTLPIAQVTPSPQGVVVRVAGSGESAQVPETPTPEPSPEVPETPPPASNEEFELVVTGEQEGGYRVPNASTATRTDTPIRDTPASIQVIPRQVLDDQRITRPREAIQNVSGVTPGASGSQSVVGESGFIFRGFAESTITSSTFVNGFRRYLGVRAADTANVEQLEILKGPASVLYGQGEPGGILNITTKQPLSTPYYAVDTTIGSFDFYRPTIDISGPLNADSTIRYRLNAAYENSGSYVDFVESEKVFVAPVISFQLGEKTTLTLEAEYFNISKVEYFGIPAVGSVIKSPFGEIPRSQYLDVSDFDLQLNRFAIGYRLQHRFSDDWSIRNGFRAELQSYEESYLFPSLRPDNRSINRTGGFDKVDSENYVLQTDVLGRIQTGNVRQDLLFGVDLARNDLILNRFNIALPAIDIFNPNRSLPPLRRIPTINRNEPQNFIGVYAQDLISIGENLKILLGGRFDYAAGSTNLQLPSGLPSEQEDSAFSPRVGIVYQPIQPVSLYASWTRSFQPSRPIFGNADGSTFKPTTGEQFEVGVKTEFLDGRLAATLAAYQIAKQNIVVTDPANPRLSLQVGEQQSQGIEFDVAGQILPSWNIIASYSYIDSEFTEDPRPAFKGDQPNNVPRNSASLAINRTTSLVIVPVYGRLMKFNREVYKGWDLESERFLSATGKEMYRIHLSCLATSGRMQRFITAATTGEWD